MTQVVVGQDQSPEIVQTRVLLVRADVEFASTGQAVDPRILFVLFDRRRLCCGGCCCRVANEIGGAGVVAAVVVSGPVVDLVVR